MGIGVSIFLLAIGAILTFAVEASVALAALRTASDRDRPFYEGKVAAARWFAASVFPELASKRAIAEATDLSLM